MFYDEQGLLILAPEHFGTKSESNRAASVRRKVVAMKKSYDFSQAKKNPYAKKLKKQVTIRLDANTIGYFKTLSGESGIPYQTLINLFLRDCAASQKRPKMNWAPSSKRAA